MDKHTFGVSRAAVNLVAILGQETPKCADRATRILTKYLMSMSSLMFIPQKNTREAALEIWRDGFRKQVKEAEFPVVVESHLLNVATGQFRKFKRQSIIFGRKGIFAPYVEKDKVWLKQCREGV